MVFDDIDAERPGTLSPAVVATIRGEIGFGGLLMTDDLSMGALSGPLETRAEAALAAGCDMILHCNGDMAEMAAVAGAVPALAGRAAERADRALMARGQGAPEDAGALEAEFIALREQAGA